MYYVKSQVLVLSHKLHVILCTIITGSVLSYKLVAILCNIITGSGTQSQTACYPVYFFHMFSYSVTNCNLSCVLLSQVLVLSHQLQVILPLQQMSAVPRSGVRRVGQAGDP